VKPRGPLLAIGAFLATLLIGAGYAASARSQAFHFFDVATDFARFDPDYAARRDIFTRRMLGLKQALFGLEHAGEPMICAHQILSELRWRLTSTTDWKAIEAELDRLARLVGDRAADRTPDRQDPADGSWGRCFTAWFFRLDGSYNHIAELADAGKSPRYPPRFLDRVNDPQRLQDYLLGVAVSDIAHEGIDHRRELNIGLADLMRLILRGWPASYRWEPALRPKLMSLIFGRLRDPATGFWGEAYRRDGRTIFVPDLGVTFHVARYLKGRVPYRKLIGWPKLIDTLLAIKNLPYPQGWRRGDGFLGHDLYDVAALFSMGWSEATAPQRASMRREIGAMLDWCLANAIRADGSVVVMPGDDSVEAATYFAVSLLDEIGYFDPAKRFWTDQPFPAAAALAAKLKVRIRAALAAGAGGEGGGYYRSALGKLDAL
jgi:hypothetical protein